MSGPAGSLPTIMEHDFSRVPKQSIPRSQFFRPFTHKTTFDAGYLVPIYRDLAYPGDTFNLNMKFFCRMATPLKPLMDNLYLDSHFWAVPIRLIDTNFPKMCGEQDDPDDTTDYVFPTITSTAVTGYLNQSVFDYMGYPTEVPGLVHNAIFLRAYNYIYNLDYRDQNIQDSVLVSKDDGPDLPTEYSLLRRGKRFDYFTSALPFAQKGPAVTIPLGTTAPILRTSNAAAWTNYNSGTDTLGGAGDIGADASSRLDIGGITKSLDPNGGLYADLTNAVAATVNTLREGITVQQLLETDARGGTRYTEIIFSHFNVISDDARMQRPEYLGGATSPIVMHPIAQTSESTSGNPQGNLTAIAFGSDGGKRHGFVKSFTEHCVVIGIVSIRADLTYQQGLERMDSYSTRYDLYWPTFANLGEQAILNKEIFAQGSVNPTVDAAVFGYQERYAEMRYKNSLITGRFRSNYAQSLDVYHLSQEFSALPELDETFIVENPPVDRVVALSEGEPQFIFDSWFDYKCVRSMPTYSIPGLTRL